VGLDWDEHGGATAQFEPGVNETGGRGQDTGRGTIGGHEGTKTAILLEKLGDRGSRGVHGLV